VCVSVPATSANLGPGYDCLGLALEVRDEVTATISSTPGVRVTVTGQGADELPNDERHLVARTVLEFAAELGQPISGLDISCINSIPQGRGMGSSAAAIVAALVITRELCQADSISDAQLLERANQIEGHPDNVAACLLGGMTISWLDEVGGAHAVSLPVAEGVVPVVGTPNIELSTKKARGMLPEKVAHVDAVFNLSRTALLVAALTTDPSKLFTATEDRLHQQYRAGAYPDSAQLVANLRAEDIAACISGAGPSVLALTTPAQSAQVVEFMQSAGFSAAGHLVANQGAIVKSR
jgi:homoserine kinase